MSDPILEAVWRVREELLKRHGGVDGYFRHVQKLDRAHRRPGRRAGGKKAGGKSAKTSP